MLKNVIISFACCLVSVSCYQPNTNSNTHRNDPEIMVTDTKGKTISLDKPAERVVALFDPAIDAFYMLQAADKLVGITAETYADRELYTFYKEIDKRIANKEIATPGTNESASIESILQLKPDLVIAQHMPEGVIKTLEAMGIPVYSASSEKYEEVLKEFEDISILVGKQERAATLLQYVKNKFAEMQEQSQKRTDAEKQSVYFTWANGRIFSTTGQNSMMHKCLELAGVTNVCTAPLDQPNINPETLIKLNPDMIVMWNDSASLFYRRKELSNITATKEKKIYNLLPMFLYNPHTLKSLCVAIRINNWAYLKDSSEADAAINEAIQNFYGKEINTLK